MKKRQAFVICLAVVYLLALSMNFMTALKYPDLNSKGEHLLVSLAFLSLLLLYSFFGGKLYRKLMVSGVIGGIFCFAAQHYQGYLYDIWIVDALSSVQYPLYVMYVAPLFGLNLSFDYTPAMYSLLVSVLFLICFIVSRIRRV